jgi:hypothetical protein
VTDPYGGRSWTPPSSADRPPPAGPPGGPSGRPPLWVVVGLPTALAGLIAIMVAAYLVGAEERKADLQPTTTPSIGSVLPSSELEGEWSGEGLLDRCAGFDDGCGQTRSVTLTIDCSRQPCAVIPFDRTYGSPPLTFQGGRYEAAGPVPAELAPTCGGVPTSTALWRLELTARNGRLVGSYAESTVQSFNCGATGVAWNVTLHRT